MAAVNAAAVAFTAPYGAEERNELAKRLRFKSTPSTAEEWSAELGRGGGPTPVDSVTLRYADSIVANPNGAASPAEKTWLMGFHKRINDSTDYDERIAARGWICELVWKRHDADPNGATGAPIGTPNAMQRDFLVRTGGEQCLWSDLSADAKKRVADAVEADSRTADATARWAPLRNAVCAQLPWKRSADEKRIIESVCKPTNNLPCPGCEAQCAVAYTERVIIIVLAAVIVLMLLFRH